MKATASCLAHLVLLASVACFAPSAAAQTPPAVPEPPAIPASSPPPSPPAAPAPPSTPVDATPRTPGYTPSASPPASPPAPPDAAPAPNPDSASAPNTAPAPNSVPPAPDPDSVPPGFLPNHSLAPAPENSRRFRDAHHDRVLLLPTAETHPKGTFYASSVEIVLLQVGYAVSDTTQITFTGSPPLGAELVVPLDLSLKTVVLREPTVSVALMGSATGVVGSGDVNGFVGRAGGAVTLCEPAWLCKLSLTFATNVALIGPGSVALGGVGLVYHFDSLFAFLAEADTAVPLGPQSGEANGVGVGAGIRFSGRDAGLDLGVFRFGKAGEPLPPLVPFIAATWRTH